MPGDRQQVCGQFITHLYHSFPLLEGGDSPHFSLASMWGPCQGTQSHKLLQYELFPLAAVQFFTNCSSVCPSLRVQSFRNMLLWWGYSMGHQSCQQTCLQYGLRSSRGHSSCQDLAEAQVSHGVTTLFRPPPAPVWGRSWAAGGSLNSCRPSGVAGSHPASPWAAPPAARESQLQCLEHSSPSALTSGSASYLKLSKKSFFFPDSWLPFYYPDSNTTTRIHTLRWNTELWDTTE